MENWATIALALLVIAIGFPATMFLAEKAGIPSEVATTEQKAWWTVAYVATLFPTIIAFGYLVVLAIAFAAGV